MDDALKTKLSELGLTVEQTAQLEEKSGAKTAEDMAKLSDAEIVIYSGCLPIPAKNIVVEFAPAPEASVSADDLNMVLPTVPDDESWAKSLRAGGVLKVEESTVISAIRAALASRVGLFDVPEKLAQAMEDYTEETEEQVTPEFYRLRKMLTQSEYGDLFAAIDGMDGRFVTKGRKREMLDRMDGQLWSSIQSFNDQLQSWNDSWMKQAMNPATMAAMVLGRTGAMPPGAMTVPDTGVLRDSAEAVNDQINRVFRGTGVQISAALAHEAGRIKEILQMPGLPAMIGTPNREQMLKKLGVSVPATYPRLEQSLTQFVLSIIKANDLPAGEEEQRYFGALVMLGGQIEWNLLNGMGAATDKTAGIGRGPGERRRVE
jgi:hypothetical protein